MIVFDVFYLILLLKISSGVCEIATINAKWNPQNGKVQSGTSWNMDCTIESNDSIIWYKHVKDIVIKLGYNDVIYSNQAGGILKAEKKSEDKDVNTWTLLLLDSHVEDSGIFECASSEQSSIKKSATFVVCDDPSDSYCDCMVNQGWAAPLCLPQLSDDLTDQYKQILAGLGITLAVTVIYCIIIGLLYGRDCFYLMHKRRMEKKNRLKVTKEKKINGPSEAVKSFEKQKYSDISQLTLNESLSENSESITFGGPSETLSEERSETSGYSGSNTSSNDKRRVSFRPKKSQKNMNNPNENTPEEKTNDNKTTSNKSDSYDLTATETMI